MAAQALTERVKKVFGWLSLREARVLEQLARHQVVLEIGSYLGKSTVAMAPVAKKIICIDYFAVEIAEGGTSKDKTGRLIVPSEKPDIRAGFEQNVKPWRDKLEVHEINSLDAVKLDWEPVGFLFIDGGHDYATISSDCGFLKWVVPGGHVAFHDVRSSKDVARAVSEAMTDNPQWSVTSRFDNLVVYQRIADPHSPGRTLTQATFSRQGDAFVMAMEVEGHLVRMGFTVPVLLAGIRRLFPELSPKGAETTQHLSDTWRYGAPTLSVSMIVKDEERFLAQCLESIKDIADEIVIVDTGSTDRTVEIAHKYTDKVYHHPWEDDFSLARNQSLGYCTKNWVLQIDADEELVQEDVALFRKTLEWVDQRPDHNAVIFMILNKTNSGELCRSRFPRLFRRRAAHWEGIVHNQLIAPQKWAGSRVRILHHGYALDEETTIKKRVRRETLLGIKVEENPLDTVAWMELIHNWRNYQEWDKVIEHAPKVLESEEAQLLTRQTTAGDLMYALADHKEWEKAEQVALTALEEYPKNLDIILALGLLYKEMGETAKAIERLEEFLEGAEEDRLGNLPCSSVARETFSMAPRVRGTLRELRKQPLEGGRHD